MKTCQRELGATNIYSYPLAIPVGSWTFFMFLAMFHLQPDIAVSWIYIIISENCIRFLITI